MKRGIIFDIDGTLWDSSKQVTESWNEILLSRGLKTITVDDMKGVMGLSMDDIGKKLFSEEVPLLEQKELMIQLTNYENEYLLKHPGDLFPKVSEILESLSKRYRLYIVTNAQSGYAEALLEGTGIGKFFSGHLAWGDNGLTKADNIKKIIELNRLDQSFYVGDTLLDEKSAKEAGIPFVHASYGFGKADSTDYSISSIDETIDISEKIFK